jgi:hypothetical protein
MTYKPINKDSITVEFHPIDGIFDWIVNINSKLKPLRISNYMKCTEVVPHHASKLNFMGFDIIIVVSKTFISRSFKAVACWRGKIVLNDKIIDSHEKLAQVLQEANRSYMCKNID